MTPMDIVSRMEKVRDASTLHKDRQATKEC